MKILVTGGNGHLGREFVRRARVGGHDLRVGSRKPRPEGIDDDVEWAQMDLGTGAGMEAAVAGAEVILHAASDSKNTAIVDVEGMRRLVAASREAGVGHLVFISIVGIDKMPFPYYERKVEAERILEESKVPCSILRATQFHYFIDMLLGASARVPLVLLIPAGFHVQSVATEEVVDRLMHVVADGPRGLLQDFGGPERLTLHEAARQWKAARGMRRPTVPVPIGGAAAVAFRKGYNTLGEDGERGTLRWEHWLERKYAPS